MIEMAHVCKSFGPVHAVRDLTLQIPRGQLFCFLGPNGAGKTTTIKLLCGLLRPDQGEIRIGGYRLQDDPLAVRRLIGYIPDFPFLYERLTAAEFYEFSGELYGIPKEKIDRSRDAAFEQFVLSDQADVLIQDLSHGYRQRLIYAVTLLHEPQVLFVDEPFVGLDPFTIRLVKGVLRQQAAAGVTIFLTTHILALIEDLAERIGILMDGRLITDGTLSELAARAGPGARLEDIFLHLTSRGAPPSDRGKDSHA